MKSHLKEIILSVAAFLLLVFAVIAFLKGMRTQKAGLEIDVYTLVPPNAVALLNINRPDLFRRMALDEPVLYGIFASEIPDMYLSILRQVKVQSAVISHHRQGLLCCIQVGQEASEVVRLVHGQFNAYTPQVQTSDGIDFYYFPDSGGRFFGYYIYNNVWVGSYSRKLLERAAEQQIKGVFQLPGEVRRLLGGIDKNSPANLLFHAARAGLQDIEPANKRSWLAADLFVNEGSFCCYSHLPYFDEEISETLSLFLAYQYPQLQFTFQVTGDDGTAVSLTACSPLHARD
ncbi:hypothetical protein FACS1894181_07110 [Bacteroidia bacterium]|nr:hypothetical protein FACS1894181_07110 [Bacteroidia bacterium]